MLCQICNEREATKNVQDVDICPTCFANACRGQLFVPNLKKLIGKPEVIEPKPVEPPVYHRHHNKAKRK
jgi:hypothetical protein